MKKIFKNILIIFISTFFFFKQSLAADFLTASEAFESKEYDVALKHLKPLSKNGHPESQVTLGWMYQNGLGVQKKVKRAYELYKSSSLNGHAQGQLNLAILYANGNGIDKNYAKAHYWLSVALDSGFKQNEIKNSLNFLENKMSPDEKRTSKKLLASYKEETIKTEDTIDYMTKVFDIGCVSSRYDENVFAKSRELLKGIEMSKNDINLFSPESNFAYSIIKKGHTELSLFIGKKNNVPHCIMMINSANLSVLKGIIEGRYSGKPFKAISQGFQLNIFYGVEILGYSEKTVMNLTLNKEADASMITLIPFN